MRRKNSWCLEIILFVIIFSFSVYGLRINEVSPETLEYVEIYNPDGLLNLSEWQIKDNSDTDYIICDGENCSLMTDATYFLIIGQSTNIASITSKDVKYFYVNDNKIGSGLNDDGDNITFFSQNFSDSFSYDSSEENKSWQYYDGEFVLAEKTPGEENNCDEDEEEEEKNITISLDYPDEIYFGEVFEVTLEIENLSDGIYDVKIEIIKDSETISDIYDDENDDWKSGVYYLSEIVDGDGNWDFDLNVTEEYFDEANISIKLRNNESKTISSAIFEIEILENEEENLEVEENYEEVQVTAEIPAEEFEDESIVYLVPKNHTTFSSKNELIKKISLYGFTIFCFFLAGIMLMKKFS